MANLFYLLLHIISFVEKVGIKCVLFCSIFLGCIPVFLNPSGELEGFGPWLIVLFTMGMCAAIVSVSINNYLLKLNWSLFTIASCLVTGFTYFFVSKRYECVDPFVGASTACALVLLTRETMAARDLIALQILTNKWVVRLGAFSYSLYLTHYAFLVKADGIVSHFSLPLVPKLLVNLMICLPASIVAAYAFYVVFERPFINIKKAL